MSEIVKSCGNQLLSKHGLKVAVTQAAAKVNPSNIYVGACLFAKVPRHPWRLVAMHNNATHRKVRKYFFDDLLPR